MRLSTPCSRRNVMLKARALKVVAMMLIPAIPGTSTWRLRGLEENTSPKTARKSSGSTKLKKAADGLRQNIRRSSRYWRQVSAASSAIGGQLEVDLLQRGPGDAQLLQPLAARHRRGRHLVQQRG